MLLPRWMKSLLPARTRPTGRRGKLWCEVLEDRTVLATLVTGAAVGEVGIVRVTDDASLQQITSFLPYGDGFLGGVNVASGDVDADGDADVITGAGAGGGPHVKVFDVATGAEVRSFFAYDPAFTGGVNVAAGDVNGDGAADIITGAGAGGGPHVKVFDGRTGAEVRSFFAYVGDFAGGVNVASGDVDGDGYDDIVTGAGAGGGPHVKVFSGKDGSELRSFFAYVGDFAGGVNVATGDVDGDGHADIVTGAGAGGGPHVKVFSGETGETLSTFFAFGSEFTGGVRVGVGADGNGDGQPDLTVGANGTANFSTFTTGGNLLSSRTLPAGGMSGGLGLPPVGTNAAPVLGSIGSRAGVTGTPVTFSLSATDADANDALTYSATGLPTGATLDATTGAFAWTPANDQFGTFVVDFAVSDGSEAVGESVTFTIADGNVAPAITSNGGGSSANLSVAENTTTVTAVTATDANAGTTLTYSIAGGADAGLFAINSTTGALSFLASPDFENAADADHDNVYDVTVRASDGTLTDTQALAVTLTDANDNAPVITSDGGGTSGTQSVAENTTAVTSVAATDADAGTTLTYSIAGGADAGLFTIDPTTGVLTFLAAPDHETPADAGGDNVYDVTVLTSDGTNTDAQALAVTVTNSNDNGPNITSDGGGVSASLSVAENTTAVTTVTATDADPGTTLTYSIIGGMDAGLFTIDPTTGVLTFVSAPDHENPADLGADNVYSLAVLVTDGMFIDIQVLAVTVTNSNDNGPNITSNGGGSSASLSVAENTTAVTTVTATDADPGTTLTYALVGGVDAALFAIDGSTGVLTFVSAPDYENPTDLGADNVYSLTVLVTDGTFIDVQSIDVTVTDGNDYAPVVSTTGGSAAYTVGDPGVVIDGGLTVTDADVGDLMAGATVDPGAGNFAPGDVLSFDSVLAAGYGISGSYDGVTTGVLTFTGNATVAEYQAVLRTVVFATSVNASFTATFTFTVNDGDVTGSGSRNVAVTNV